MPNVSQRKDKENPLQPLYNMTTKTDQVIKISKWFVTLTKGGFHLTPSLPCWYTEQKRIKCFRNLTLNINTQNMSQICLCFVHQHGRLITWLKTICRVNVHGHKSNKKRHKNNLRLFFKLLNAIRKPRTWEIYFFTLFTSLTPSISF